MPTALRWKGYRFYFYSGDSHEPPHIHVDHAGRTAKVWLSTLEVAYNDGYSARDLAAVLDVVDQNRAWTHGMSTLTIDDRAMEIADVACTEDELVVRLKDGRRIASPLWWYPRLLHASPEERARWEIAGRGRGIHWPLIDEDLSIEGMLRGAKAPGAKPPASQP